MSNLSELLPTGGGQNAVDFVASGTLPSGQAVALKTNGQVEAVAAGGPASAAPVLVSSGTNSFINGSAYDSVAQKVVILYNPDSVMDAIAVVGTVSGSTISFGTPTTVNTGSVRNCSVVYDSVNQKVVLIYNIGGVVYGAVGTVSGTSISVGSSTGVSVGGSYGPYLCTTYDSDLGKVVVGIQGTSAYAYAVVGTVSGTSISFGTSVVVNSVGSYDQAIAYDQSAQKVGYFYRQANVGSFYGRVGTVSGTSISFGAQSAGISGTPAYADACYDSNAQKIVVVYSRNSSANRPYCVVATITGTSLSFGTPAQINIPAVGSEYNAISYDSEAQKVVVTNYVSNLSPQTVIGTVSGTSITFGTGVTLVSSTGLSRSVTSVFDPDANKTVISTEISSPAGLSSVVFSASSTNNTSFIGITSEAISSGATGAINTYGGINTAQTGLTIASDYYVQSDGSLAAGVTSIPYDISSATYTQNFSVSSQDTSPQGLAFSPDGTKMFMVGYADDKVFQYALSTAFDISTASYSSIYFSVSGQETIPRGLAFSVDGVKMFVLGTTADQVFEYTLSSAFNVSTASFVDAFSVAAQETDPQGIAFSTDGAKMFITGHTGQDVNEYALSTVFDVSTASYTQNFSISGQETQPTGIAFNSVGTKMFIIGVTGQDVNEYTLSTGFNVSTASFSGITFSVATQETSPQAVVFNTTGTNFYVLGASGDDINQYATTQTTFVTTVKAGQAISATTINMKDLT